MKNQRGFGLIELMVCVALLSIVIVGMMQAMYVAALQQTTNDVKNSVTAINGMTTATAIDQTACTAAVTRTIQSYGPAIRFDMPDGASLAANSQLQDYGVYVQSFNVTNASLVATGYDGTKVYYGSLALALATRKIVIGPNHFAPRTVASVYLTVSPAGIVTQCGSALPQLPNPPTASSNPQDFARGCFQIGGIMSHGVCTFSSGGR